MQKQRKMDELYVNEAVNNMGYIYKDQAKQNIIKFLANETSFRPFDAVRSIFLCQQQTGMALSYHLQSQEGLLKQMIIGVPDNFPQGPPIFLLSVNRALFRINKQQQMIMNKQILLQKDETGLQFIRFNFPFLSNGWKPMTSLTDIYKQFQIVVSSPPILIEITMKKFNEWEELHQSNRGVANNQQNQSNHSVKNLPGLTNLIDSKSVELSNIFSTLTELQCSQQNLTYQESRNHFLLNQHLSQLQKNLNSKSDQLTSKTLQVKEILSKSLEKSTCDDFLIISQKDSIKLQNMAERQALKDAQKKVKETLQKQLQNGKKYSEYKKIVRTLFSQMYENQSKILQTAE